MAPKLTPKAAFILAKALLEAGGEVDPRLEAVIIGSSRWVDYWDLMSDEADRLRILLLRDWYTGAEDVEVRNMVLRNYMSLG